MKEYLYFDTIFKTHLIASSELGDRYTLIGEISEIVEVYQNRGKSPYNKTALDEAIAKAKPNMDKIKDVDTFLDDIK